MNADVATVQTVSSSADSPGTMPMFTDHYTAEELADAANEILATFASASEASGSNAVTYGGHQVLDCSREELENLMEIAQRLLSHEGVQREVLRGLAQDEELRKPSKNFDGISIEDAPPKATKTESQKFIQYNSLNRSVFGSFSAVGSAFQSLGSYAWVRCASVSAFLSSGVAQLSTRIWAGLKSVEDKDLESIEKAATILSFLPGMVGGKQVQLMTGLILLILKAMKRRADRDETEGI